MSSKSLAKAHHFLPSDQQRDEIIRGFLAEHLTVVDQFSTELDMMSHRFSHSLRKYVAAIELLDRVDAKVNEINAFCEGICPKPSTKTEIAPLSQKS